MKVELLGSDPSGEALQVIAGGVRGAQPVPFPYSPPSWSADGSRVAFTGIEGRGLSGINVYVVAADGSGLTKVPGTREALYPVLSPDSQSVAFGRLRERRGQRGTLKFEGAAVFTVNVSGGPVRRLTPWRNGLQAFPSSFSPDGSTLAISQERHPRSGPHSVAALAIRLDGSGVRVLARNASQPVYSPDGTRLALIAAGKRKSIGGEGVRLTYTESELAVANADGSGLTKLTATRGLELLPSWDPSGERLAFTYLPIDLTDILERGSSIMAVNADGSCHTPVLSYDDAFLFGAVWQPGPGREAGRIPC
jgi:Tol biopolymer transport system component